MHFCEILRSFFAVVVVVDVVVVVVVVIHIYIATVVFTHDNNQIE